MYVPIMPLIGGPTSSGQTNKQSKLVQNAKRPVPVLLLQTRGSLIVDTHTKNYRFSLLMLIKEH